MSIAGDDSLPCFPNPFFSQSDVSQSPDGKILIDISRETPPPPFSPGLEAELFGDDSSDTSGEEDYIPPPLIPPDHPHTIANVLALTLRIPLHDLLSTNFGSLLSGMTHNGTYVRPSNTYKRLPNGAFALRRHYRLHITERLISCAGLISTALNNQVVDGRGFIPEAIPVTVPAAALDESRIPFPAILVFLSRGWTLEEREFDTQEEVESLVDDFLEALRLGIAIFGKIMVVTKRLGVNSVCNPGAGIEMGKEEFLERAGRLDYVGEQVELWLDQMIFSNPYIRRSDDACARLFTTQIFSVFITLELNNKVALVPRVAPGVVHDGHTHRIHTNAETFGQQLAMWGF